MKKNYIYPTVESVRIDALTHLCGASGNRTDVVTGGKTGVDPSDPNVAPIL